MIITYKVFFLNIIIKQILYYHQFFIYIKAIFIIIIANNTIKMLFKQIANFIKKNATKFGNDQAEMIFKCTESIYLKKGFEKLFEIKANILADNILLLSLITNI